MKFSYIIKIETPEESELTDLDIAGVVQHALEEKVRNGFLKKVDVYQTI